MPAPEPPPPPATARDAAPAAAPGALDASIDAGSTGAADAAPEAQTDASLPEATVELERPFKLHQRPRPKGEVHAAGEDEELARWNVGGTGDPAFVSNRPGYHPAPRVRVDTRITRGRLPKRSKKPRTLTEDRVLARARKYGYWPFRLCFEAGLRADQQLHGKTEIRFSIRGDGSVRRARLVSTKLDRREVAECLASKSERLTFLPPPRARIDVEMTVALWPGDAPVPLAGPPSDPAPDNPGELDTDAVAAALEVRRSEIGDCYRRGLARDGALWGRIQVRVDLDARGELLGAREDESRFPDRAVARCVVHAVRAVPFPIPKGGALSLVVAARLGMPPARNE